MSRKGRPALSKGESVVASALWRLGSGALGEIHKEVIKHQEMDYLTVQSYIRRLEVKGYVQSKKQGRIKVYSSAVKPETVIGRSVDNLIEQMVSGEAMPILRHLIQCRDLSKDEIAELRKMINEAESKEGPRNG